MAPLELRAGPLTMLFEPQGAFLRTVRLGEREILRGVYAAVRDSNWDTIAPRVFNLQQKIATDEFHLSFDVECRRDEIDFLWHGTLSGDAQGTVIFALNGVARSTFRRNRIGFCVLHPIRECAGAPCVVESVAGELQDCAFPAVISPHQPFREMRAITHEVVPGVRAQVRFDGDIFEMEDQRNWTDASFKTYCTPLALPYPVEIEAATEISQTVSLTLEREAAFVATANATPTPLDAPVTFGIDGRAPLPLPRIGLGSASHGQPLSEREIERLKALHLSHLRVDLRLYESNWQQKLQSASAEAKALGVSLEIAVLLSDAAEAELQALTSALETVQPLVAAWLIFHRAELSTGERWVQIARRHLADYDPTAKIGAGTDAYFAELNRGRPSSEQLDLVCYPINPQVHAFDNTSIVESLEAQAATVETARHFAAALPIAVTPITFKARFNPHATSPESQTAPGELPSAVDARQMSLFGAGWTLGSLKYLAQSGVWSTTYYETTGWRGVMEIESGSSSPAFPSLPRTVFPLYHILADGGEFKDGQILPSQSSAPLRVDGMVLRHNDKICVLLANLTGESQHVEVRGLQGETSVRFLDETNAEAAMSSPEEFRARRPKTPVIPNGPLKLELLPYAIARVDAGGIHKAE